MLRARSAVLGAYIKPDTFGVYILWLFMWLHACHDFLFPSLNSPDCQRVLCCISRTVASNLFCTAVKCENDVIEILDHPNPLCIYIS